MGKLRIEARGTDKQPGLPGTDVVEQAWRADIGTMENHLDARTAVKALAKVYSEETTLQVWEKVDGKWVIHFEVKGSAHQDKHEEDEPEEPEEPEEGDEAEPENEQKPKRGRRRKAEPVEA